MKTTQFHSKALILLASLLLSACGDSEQEQAAQQQATEDAARAAAKEAQAENDQNLEQKLSSGLAGIQKAAQEELGKTKSELETTLSAELEERKRELTEQFEASNAALRQQVETLAQHYQTAEPQLPQSVQEPVQEKLPELRASLQRLESLVSEFSPESIQQIEQFRARYQAEFDTARQLYNELVALLAETEIGKKLPTL